jgi:hypothetical protein
MTAQVEPVTTFQLQHRLPSGAKRVLGAAPTLWVAQHSASNWRRLLRRLGGTGLVVVVDAATGTVVASGRIDGAPW